jgi:hypothetical protein
MKYLTLSLLSIFLISCGMDYNKMDKWRFKSGQIAIADLKSYAYQMDSILDIDINPKKVIVPDSVKGKYSFNIFSLAS